MPRLRRLPGRAVRRVPAPTVVGGGVSDWLTTELEAAHREHTDGRTYGHDVAAGQTDCVITVEAMLAAVYGPEVYDHRADLRVWDARRPWSAVDACSAFGGVPVADPVPGCWHVVQGWRRLPRGAEAGSGHVLMYYHPPDGGVGRVLEANLTRPWDRRVTWGEVRGRYPAGVRLAWMRGLPGR